MTGPAGALAGRSVLVTGHTGFKGSWLALWLVRLGATVSGLALDPPTEPSNYAASRLAGVLAADLRADVRDGAAVRAALDTARPEVVFHLAAQPLVRRGVEDPYATFDVNVMGTTCLLEAVRLAGAPCVVIVVTSDKCYDLAVHDGGHAETDPLGGTEPYGTSKAAAELVVGAYRATFFPPERLAEHGVRLATVRAGNVIGGGDWAEDRVVPDTLRSLAAGRPVPIRFPEAVRPWQHVVEPLAGYLTLAGRLVGEDPVAAAPLCTGWNFGPLPGDEVTVRRVVETAVRCWGTGGWTLVGDDVRRHEAAALRLRVDKAAAELGWYPRWRVDEAVARTVSWYRRFHADPGADMAAACLEDIAAYEVAGRDGGSVPDPPGSGTLVPQ